MFDVTIDLEEPTVFIQVGALPQTNSFLCRLVLNFVLFAFNKYYPLASWKYSALWTAHAPESLMCCTLHNLELVLHLYVTLLILVRDVTDNFILIIINNNNNLRQHHITFDTNLCWMWDIYLTSRTKCILIVTVNQIACWTWLTITLSELTVWHRISHYKR